MLKKTREKDGAVKKRRSKLNVKPGESVYENHFQDPSTSNRENVRDSGGHLELIMSTQDGDTLTDRNIDPDSSDNDHETADPFLIGFDEQNVGTESL